jgi:hypothetical protein
MNGVDDPSTLAQAMRTFANMLCEVEELAKKVDRLLEKVDVITSRPVPPADSAKRSDALEKEFYTVKEVAAIIGTSEKSVRRLQKRGFFRSSKALRIKRIPRSEIDRYKRETV